MQIRECCLDIICELPKKTNQTEIKKEKDSVCKKEELSA
jgi:hypothetical protein